MPALEELAAQIRECPACDLCQTRTQAVPGEGPADARIFFIGEGPGYYEDKSGRPFVGAAGKFLDDLLASIKLDRSKVFITNVVKCRPPGNRDPLPVEIAACKPWLDQQLGQVKPSVIVTLGRHSMNRFFPGESISRIHGQARRVDGLMVVPMFHPAAALHQQRFRAQIEDDFRRLLNVLAEVEQQSAPAVDPQQQLRLL